MILVVVIHGEGGSYSTSWLNASFLNSTGMLCAAAAVHAWGRRKNREYEPAFVVYTVCQSVQKKAAALPTNQRTEDFLSQIIIPLLRLPFAIQLFQVYFKLSNLWGLL